MLLNAETYQTITRTHFYLTSDSGIGHSMKKRCERAKERTEADDSKGWRFLYWDDYEDQTDEE